MTPDKVAGPATDVTSTPADAQAPRGLSPEPQQASPEEQKLYERFVSKAFIMVYDEKFLPKAVDMLAGEGDPQEGLARLTSMVVLRVMKAAKQAGQELGGDVLFAGGKEIFEDLAELSRQAGVFDYSQDADALEGAYFRALDHFRMALEGEGEVDRESAQADLDMLQKMDEAGELEGYFRTLADRDGAAAGGDEPESQGEAMAETPADEASEPPMPPRGTGLMQQGMK